MSDLNIYSNTLVFTNLPQSLFESTLLSILKQAVESYAKSSDGCLYSWIPLPSFCRIIAVFWDNGDAEICKDKLDRLAIGTVHQPPKYQHFSQSHIRKRHRARSDCPPLASEWKSGFILRVFSLPPTPTTNLWHGDNSVFQSNYLTVPGVDKNFLISPPGSPPIGWEPIKEDPPNTQTLAEDLVEALKSVQSLNDDDYDNNNDQIMHDVTLDTDSNKSISGPSTPKLLISPSFEVPGVSIANYSFDFNLSTSMSENSNKLNISSVKATSDCFKNTNNNDSNNSNNSNNNNNTATKYHSRTPSLTVPGEPSLAINDGNFSHNNATKTKLKPTPRPPV